MPLSSSHGINKNHANVHLQCRKNANAILMETHIKDAMSKSWQGHRATRWLKLWDAGNRKTREYLLCAFVELHHGSPISVVDADLGPAAPLWFTRITSYLQISYKRLAANNCNEEDASTWSKASQMQHISKVINVQLVANKGQPIKASALTSPDAFNSFAIASTKLDADKMTVKEDARVTRTGIVVQRQLAQSTKNKSELAQNSNQRRAGEYNKSQAIKKKSMHKSNNHNKNDNIDNNSNNNIDKNDNDREKEVKEKDNYEKSEERHEEESELLSRAVMEEHEAADSILSLLISSITIFVRGANYLTQFMEAGGAATLLDCLESGTSKWQLQFSLVSHLEEPLSSSSSSSSLLLLYPTNKNVFTVQLAHEPIRFQQLTTHERCVVIRLLLYIVNAGRIYREMITDMTETAQPEVFSSSFSSLPASSHANTKLLNRINKNTLDIGKLHFEELQEMPSHLLCLLHVFERESDGEVAALMAELFIALIHGHHYNTVVSQCITTALLRIILRHAVMEHMIVNETNNISECCNYDDADASMAKTRSSSRKECAKQTDSNSTERQHSIDEQKLTSTANMTTNVHKELALNESEIPMIEVNFIYEEVIVQATRVLRAVQLLQEAEYVKYNASTMNPVKVQDNMRPELYTSRHVVEFNAMGQKENYVDNKRSNNNIINRRCNNTERELNLTSVYDTVPVVGLFCALEDNSEDNRRNSTNNNVDKLCVEENKSTYVNNTQNNVNVEMTSDSNASWLFTHLTVNEYLEALLHLAFNLESTRLRVEGTELITLLTKNISLLLPAINRCVDVIDDDEHEIRDRDNVEQLRQRQRRQIFAGRTLVQIMRSTPMSRRRAELMFGAIAVRSAHFSLLKYLCMTDATDTATVHEACEVIKWFANTAHRIEMQSLRQTCNSENTVNNNIDNKLISVNEDVMNENVQDESSNTEYLCKVGWDISHVLGKSLFDLLISNASNFDVRKHKNDDGKEFVKSDNRLSDEECFAIMRATRAGLASQM